MGTFTKSARLARLALLTAVLLCAATAVWGGEEKLAKELRSAPASGPVDVIVRYKTAPKDEHHQKITRGGGAVKNKFDLIQSGR